MLSSVFDGFLTFGKGMFTGENIMSYIVIGIIIVIAIICNIVFKKLDPTKPEKGFALVMVFIVEKVDAMVEDLMGKKYNGFGGYILGLASYIVLSFMVGLIGLPGPLTNLGNAFSIGLCSFVLIHANAVKANKIGYFKRFIEPIPFLLPINLLSMWAPLLSLSIRIFGNALSGFTLMSIVYWALNKLSLAIFGFMGSFGGIILAPIFTPILHAYFDVFSGAIQTLIFTMLTMILVSLEDLDPEFE